ncbi:MULTISPECIES: ferrous iron transport protein B [Sorangium]|uniref:Ferrous iron transport protein B n=1 Tax=Sorangium cellulosum TaxID=56 RepID=A0A4P2R4F2_SORCE|nr:MULTISPECIES: ferrous iron transport protein B [Sorangium]AUX37501.1 iron transporter FeoB [Sorangium cellulosum]WCQ96792.1 Fe(2+) transporter FeoB [Sorangium sp. Soce836]
MTAAASEVRAARLPAAAERPLVALLGRPNSGKSSLFNRLTGGSAHVGNFPGITVDILTADVRLAGGKVATIADLPGLYSIESVVDPATDEGVARRFLDRTGEGGRPRLVVQVLDATQLALGLRLTRELVRRGLAPLLVATQRDVLEAEGRGIDLGALERAIGLPVLLVSARDPAARGAVLDAIAARLDAIAAQRDAIAAQRGAGAAQRDAGAAEAPGAAAWDPDVVARAAYVEAARRDAAAERRRTFTARADAVLLHPAAGPVLFLGLMALLFAAVFLVATPATEALDAAIGQLGGLVSRALGGGLAASFVVDGLLGGAGTVLAFMPQIVILTVAMELLEASGYLARGAFLVDRLLQLMGLSGRAFLPLLMGHACAVPAVHATRILRDPRERLTAILVLPLMACSARIPTYALLLTTFFAAHGPWVQALLFVALYVAGIFSGLVASLVLRRTATRGRSLPMVLEMPAYRSPEVRVVARKASQAAWRFTREVGTVILAVSAVLWVLLKVPMPGAAPPEPPAAAAETAATPLESSIAGGVGRALEPVTAPLGFDWRINVGLIGSFGAREVMVGTMGVIFGIEDAADEPAPLAERIREATRPDGTLAYSTRTGLALLAFFVLACQCMSTVAAIRRETKTWRWPAFVLAYSYAAAYVAALVVYQGSGLLGIP